ncbi:hypothetical protein D3C80_1250450 [compost metagenome]
MRSTAPGPRIPNPMNAIRTVGIGDTARRKTSVCPFGRFGEVVFIICADVTTQPNRQHIISTDLKKVVFIII